MGKPIKSRKVDYLVAHKASGGFTLFEVVVFIIFIAIIYAAASNRFAEFPGEAERANFLAVSSQIQAAVNLELMLGMLSSNQDVIAAYATANPMDFLLETPSNYLGALYIRDSSTLPRRSWYFDEASRELVYLINDAADVFIVREGRQEPVTELRFRIEIDYRYLDRLTGRSLPRAEAEQIAGSDEARIQKSLAGMVLRPVSPYIWGASPTFMADITPYQAPG